MVMTPRQSRCAGFTLAELVVATTLITIVMAAVYSSMTNSLRTWKIAEADMAVYQNARTALDILTRELQCVIPGAAHLMGGDDQELTFYAVVPPMEVDDGEGPRVMEIRYRLASGRSRGEGRRLVREERVVESALPLVSPGQEPVDRGRLKLGPQRAFDLATGVGDFKLAYYWRPPQNEWPPRHPDQPPEPIYLIVEQEHREKWGLPQGILVSLTLDDPNDDTGQQVFSTFVTFRSPTGLYNRQFFGRTGAG
jgi:prepilin-type N-terminal cleavage/methylation domain-containing protein